MPTFRVNKTDNYTVMSNYHLRDKNLSLKAKGLLSWMLSLPEDWDYSLRGIVSCHKEGNDAIKSALKELKKNNYLTIKMLKPESYINESGEKITVRDKLEWEYNIYEQPMLNQDEDFQANQSTGFHYIDNDLIDNDLIDNDLVENPAQINTKKENTKEINTYNKAPEPASVGFSSKRNFRRETEQLTDELSSGKEIDSQKKKKKEKVPILTQCLDEIERESYGFDSDTKQLLAQYAAFATDGSDSRRVKSSHLWQKKLTDLLSLSNNDNIVMQKIIKQSLEKKWYKFVEYEEVKKSDKRKNTATVDGLIHQKRDGRIVLEERRAKGYKAF